MDFRTVFLCFIIDSVYGDNGTVETLKEIAYYLRSHKFNEYDRRYEHDTNLARREYYKEFPRPPLRSLHWEVHKFCEQSLAECTNYLARRIKKAGMKRSDDTSVVIQDQKWDVQRDSEKVDIVEQECKKLRDLDDTRADPFEGPLERFQWRVTASYYLCWYTMKSEPLLAHISERCDNFANCLDPVFGPNNLDHRADDSIAFACALYSFCPDPCCPLKHLTAPENCWNMPDNVCFQANPAGQRDCGLLHEQNRDFRDIVLNRWNVTCHCNEKGFVWSSLYGMCIDVNECAAGAHTCDSDKEICLNLPGSYKCACKWGHTFDAKSGKCKGSNALIHLVLEKHEDEEIKPNITRWMQFLQWFERSGTIRLRACGGCVLSWICFLWGHINYDF